MYRAAICEDEKVFLNKLRCSCHEILDRLNADYDLAVFDNSADLLSAFSDGQRFDLLLLDIVMDGINGMEMARMIRGADREATIIFITCNNSYALQGYDVKALHYLMKPVDVQALEKLITADYKDRFQLKYIILEKNSQKTRVPINDIICLEIVGRKVDITLHGGTLCYSGKLTELLERLPKGQFIRCHQAYAVNLQNIKELDRKNAIALNKKIIPISRVYKNEVQKAFLKTMKAFGH